MSWYYEDDDGNVSGPYTALEIRDWYANDQLPPEIRIKREDGEWGTLGEEWAAEESMLVADCDRERALGSAQNGETMYMYLDDDGNEQGPFDEISIREWFETGFFNGDRQLRAVEGTDWRRLDDTFPEYKEDGLAAASVSREAGATSAEWFYVDSKNESIGPKSRGMMIELLGKRVISKETYVSNGVIDWTPLRETSLSDDLLVALPKKTAVSSPKRMPNTAPRRIEASAFSLQKGKLKKARRPSLGNSRRRRKSQFMLAEMEKRRKEVSGKGKVVRKSHVKQPSFKMFGGGEDQALQYRRTTEQEHIARATVRHLTTIGSMRSVMPPNSKFCLGCNKHFFSRNKNRHKKKKKKKNAGKCTRCIHHGCADGGWRSWRLREIKVKAKSYRWHCLCFAILCERHAHPKWKRFQRPRACGNIIHCVDWINGCESHAVSKTFSCGWHCPCWPCQLCVSGEEGNGMDVTLTFCRR